MSKKQVIYFYEGETEKKLLRFLKDSKKIKAGKVGKFNLWNQRFKVERTINRNSKLFFIVDTDDVTNTNIFVENIKLLKPYDVCLIIQNKNLEDELCFACKQSNHKDLFKYFYNTTHVNQFKKKFNKEKDLGKKLTDNNFSFDRLWIRNKDFSDDFLEQHSLKVNINCKYRK